MEKVEGKVAFISGGSGGIGLGMTKAFLKAGMKVVIAGRKQENLDRAMAQLGSDKKNAHAIRLDVTDREAMSRAADETERVFGKIHVVCNNAGVFFFEPDERTYKEWDSVIGVNLGGVINGMQTFIPRIKKHGEGGHIVNTCSLAAFVDAGRDCIMYSTSKYAIRGLTEGYRFVLAECNIGTSLLIPGAVNSGLHGGESPSQPSQPQAKQEAGPSPGEVLSKYGMAPVEVGEWVLKGIRQNNFYIFTHPGFREEIKEIYQEIHDAMPPGEFHPEMLAFEDARRLPRRKAKAALR